MSDAEPQSFASRYALAFIFITMLVDTIGLGIIIPVGPKIIAELTHQDMAGAARWSGWLFFVYALMQFLCAPLIGNLSDRFGRRPVLILALLALGFDYLLTGLAPTIAWLFVARFLSGMAGASYTTANAYIADITPPEKRAANFALTGAAFSVGFTLSPGIGGFLGSFGPRIPFFFAAALSLANALFGYFVLKESLKPEHRRKFDLARANPLGALQALRRLPGVFWLVVVMVLMRLAHDSNPAVFSFYVYAKFDWSTKMVGYALMAVGALMTVVYGFLVRAVVPKIGETASVYLGLVSGAIGFAGYAFATESWMMFAFMVPFSLMAFVMPALNATMSKMVGPSEQGELQGALTCIGSLTSIVSPPLLTTLFWYFSRKDAPVYFPGAAFLAASLFLVVAALVFTRMRAPNHELQPAE
ncbi:MAG TPA: TCR/Tet family MFS transporter [Rhizomicrobium sp.]|nr:TCR/Tet family MFS transporter [Rhizomicrobium sp.]